MIAKSGRKEGGQRGTFPGYGELVTLSKGISEGEETNYKHQEELLLETNYEVRNLINEQQNNLNLVFYICSDGCIYKIVARLLAGL